MNTLVFKTRHGDCLWRTETGYIATNEKAIRSAIEADKQSPRVFDVAFATALEESINKLGITSLV